MSEVRFYKPGDKARLNIPGLDGHGKEVTVQRVTAKGFTYEMYSVKDWRGQVYVVLDEELEPVEAA